MQQCNHAAKPLKYLPLALQLLNYESGNVWLDTCSSWEIEESLPWTTENINYLKVEWQEGQRPTTNPLGVVGA